MADNAPRVIRCLIEGDSSTFKIKPTGDTEISDLRGLIKEERKHRLSSVDAADLTLWKVRMIMVSDSTANSPAGQYRVLQHK